MATKTSGIPRNLNFLGETAFWEGIFCLEYPSRRSDKVNCHFVNYRLSFRKLQIFISQTADFHFANYRSSFRKLQILISQTTNFHFANYRFSFRKLQIFISFRFANRSKPIKSLINLGKTFFWISRIRIVGQTWFLIVYLSSFISQIPDFLYSLVWIFPLIAWQWKHRLHAKLPLFCVGRERTSVQELRENLTPAPRFVR